MAFNQTYHLGETKIRFLEIREDSEEERKVFRQLLSDEEPFSLNPLRDQSGDVTLLQVLFDNDVVYTCRSVDVLI